MQHPDAALTAEIAELYLTGLRARNADALLSLFHDDVLVFGRTGAITSHGELRELFAFAFTAFGDALHLLRVERQDVVGDSAFILWSVPGYVPMGITSFTVADGRIQRATLVAHTEGLLAREHRLGRFRGQPEHERPTD